uniref:Uncharacterized protein n=1 Tax=Arundo donax TaxID=35708 RepID=A0A0A9BPS9_ARUDO
MARGERARRPPWLEGRGGRAREWTSPPTRASGTRRSSPTSTTGSNLKIGGGP